MKAKRRGFAERRHILGYSQEKLAEILGVERSTVGRWECGETSPQTVVPPRLADALKVSPEELDRLLTEGQPVLEISDTSDEPVDPEQDPVLSAPWTHRSTVEVAIVLRGGDRVKRRRFTFLTGTASTAPALQWLVHDPGPLISGLAGRRVSTELADRFTAMITELRAMDDVAGGGTVFSLAQHQFGLVADLLHQAAYDEPTGRQLHVVLAELGQLCGWCGYDAGQAAAMLDEGIALFDESFVRDRTNYLIHLADALAQPGPQRDLDAAAERGVLAIDLAESLDSARGNSRLRDLCLQMKPHAEVPAVEDFLDRARGRVQV